MITTNQSYSASGGCPIIYAKDDKEMQTKALLLAKSVSGMVHEIDSETLIIVKH